MRLTSPLLLTSLVLLAGACLEFDPGGRYLCDPAIDPACPLDAGLDGGAGGGSGGDGGVALDGGDDAGATDGGTDAGADGGPDAGPCSPPCLTSQICDMTSGPPVCVSRCRSFDCGPREYCASSGLCAPRPPCPGGACPSGLVCHPVSAECVQPCSVANECGQSESSCATYAGQGRDGGVASLGAQKICQCTSSALCNPDGGNATVCSTTEAVCARRCATSSDCGGRTCQVDAGVCLPCSPGCTGDTQCNLFKTPSVCERPCSYGQCANGEVCSYPRRLCQPAPSCSGLFQPASCAYGQYCTPNGCVDVTPPGCPNFSPSAAHDGGWDPQTFRGPVIWNITQSVFAEDAWCVTGFTHVVVRARAYATDAGAFSSASQLATTLHYVRVDGSEGSATVTAFAGANNGQGAEYDVNFCVPGSATTLSVGLHHVGGNEACFSAVR